MNKEIRSANISYSIHIYNIYLFNFPTDIILNTAVILLYNSRNYTKKKLELIINQSREITTIKK